jgi:hypothetical protein
MMVHTLIFHDASSSLESFDPTSSTESLLPSSSTDTTPPVEEPEIESDSDVKTEPEDEAEDETESSSEFPEPALEGHKVIWPLFKDINYADHDMPLSYKSSTRLRQMLARPGIVVRTTSVTVVSFR